MTRIEILKRDLETLRESMKLDAEELARATPQEKQAILEHLRWCADEIVTLKGMFGDV